MSYYPLSVAGCGCQFNASGDVFIDHCVCHDQARMERGEMTDPTKQNLVEERRDD
jgi:hypothetical protein